MSDSRPLLLDGATGTELTRRGVDTALPLWSAAALQSAPAIVQEIHQQYVSAGAEIITANTFRTHQRNLDAAGVSASAAELTELAVQLARTAAGQRAFVAGSQAPLEDCYSPQLVPEQTAVNREHLAMSRNLADAGVDLILVETQLSIREAVAATRSAATTGLPVFVSFVCHGSGKLLSGESLRAAMDAVRPFSPAALLINCVATSELGQTLPHLATSGIPFGGQGNIGLADPQQGWQNTDAHSPEAYAAHARTWLATGASLLGGCCGTTPRHIERLRELLDEIGG